MNDWISVKDELPIETDDYLVCLPNGHIHIGYWMSGEFWSTGYYTSSWEVTHWMPLPAPPKEG